MKIYFAGSIRGGRDDAEIYLKIINHLKKHGQVLTVHIGDQKLTHLGEQGISDNAIYERDMSWVKECDVLVAEVTTPSHGVGYEIAKAEERGKRVLCLYKPKKGRKLSTILSGDRNTTVQQYKTLKQAFEIIDEFLKDRSPS